MSQKRLSTKISTKECQAQLKVSTIESLNNALVIFLLNPRTEEQKASKNLKTYSSKFLTNYLLLPRKKEGGGGLRKESTKDKRKFLTV